MKQMILAILAAATAGTLSCGCSATQIAQTQASGLLAPALGLGGALAGSYAAKDEDDGTRLAATGAAAAGRAAGAFITARAPSIRSISEAMRRARDSSSSSGETCDVGVFSSSTGSSRAST